MRHVEEALERLTEAYMALGITGEVQMAAVVLGHNFPDSKWYQDAYQLVKSNGVWSRARTRAPGSARRSRGYQGLRGSCPLPKSGISAKSERRKRSWGAAFDDPRRVGGCVALAQPI